MTETDVDFLQRIANYANYGTNETFLRIKNEVKFSLEIKKIMGEEPIKSLLLVALMKMTENVNRPDYPDFLIPEAKEKIKLFTRMLELSENID